MEKFLNHFHFLKSRKFWAGALAWLTVLAACLQVEPFPWSEFIEKTVQIGSVYIGGVAFEDGLSKVIALILTRQSGTVTLETSQMPLATPIHAAAVVKEDKSFNFIYNPVEKDKS